MKKILLFIFMLFSVVFYSKAVVDPENIYINKGYYNSLYKEFPVGIAFLSEDGYFLYVNDILCSFLGRTRSELMNLTWLNITAKEDIETDIIANQRVIDGKDQAYTLFKQYVHKRGERLWAKLSVKGVRKEDGSFDHFVSVVEPLANNLYFEASLSDKLDDIKRSLDKYEKTSATNGDFFSKNWKTLIPWTIASVIAIGGIIFKVQTDSKKIENLEKRLQKNG